MTRHSAALCLVAALLGGLGCRQVLGVDDYRVGDTSFEGANDGFHYSSESCRDCVDKSCSGKATTCAGDPACAARGQCLARCASNDSPCRGTCNLSVPDSLAMRELVACEANSCKTCGASRAVLGGASCDDCLLKHSSCGLDAFSSNIAALNLAACDPEGCVGAPKCDFAPPVAEATCSVYAAGSEARSLVTGCTSGVCASFCARTLAKPDWSCLGHVQWPPLSESQRGPGLSLQIRPINLWHQSDAAPNLSVSACGPRDQSCKNPIVPPELTDPSGWVSLNLPDPKSDLWFFDHLKVTDPKLDPPHDLSALLYAFPPPRDSPAVRSIRILPKSLADTNAGSIPKLVLDWENNGGIAFSVVSCNGATAAGVTVESSTGGSPYYSPGAGPSSATAMETYASGLGVLANVPPGNPTLTLTAKLGGQVIFEQEIVVEKGLITSVPIVPSPIE